LPSRPRNLEDRATLFRLAVVLFLAVALTMGGCGGKRLTKANVQEVTDGMSRKQVESILGPPTSIDSTNLLVTRKVTYTYRQGDEAVTIVFFNDQVSSKESNLHD
jgi:outer membrane protein assembly factor BamE (lipoprotein component of BamABCDE complex)